MSDNRIQAMNCPACNATLENYQPTSAKVVCEYCGAVIDIAREDSGVAAGAAGAKQIVPLTASADSFIAAIIAHFVEEDYISNDIFQAAQFGQLTPYYLPFFRYKGQFTSAWRCEVGTSESRQRIVNGSDGKPKTENYTETVWRPTSGVALGDYDFVCLANDGGAMPDALAAYAHQLWDFPGKATAFESHYLQGPAIVVADVNLDKQDVFEEHGPGYIEILGDQASEEQVGSSKHRNLSVSTSHTEKSAEQIYLPFWFGAYTYQGAAHHVLMDASGECISDSTFPKDTDRQAATAAFYKPATYTMFAGLVATVVAAIVGAMKPEVGYVYAIAIAVVSIVVWFVLRGKAAAQAKELLDGHRGVREQSKHVLENQLRGKVGG